VCRIGADSISTLLHRITQEESELRADQKQLEMLDRTLQIEMLLHSSCNMRNEILLCNILVRAGLGVNA
jgi:hypothetical protein